MHCIWSKPGLRQPLHRLLAEEFVKCRILLLFACNSWSIVVSTPPGQSVQQVPVSFKAPPTVFYDLYSLVVCAVVKFSIIPSRGHWRQGRAYSAAVLT